MNARTRLARMGLLSAAVASLLAMTPVAQAHDHDGDWGYRGGYSGYHGDHWGGYRYHDHDVAAGLLTAAVVGGLIYAGTHDRVIYTNPPVVYGPPPPRIIYTQPPVTYYPAPPVYAPPVYAPPVVVYRGW